MKRICTFLLILVAVFLLGCAKTPGTEVFRFEVRSYELTIGEEVQLDLIMGSHEGEEVVFEVLDGSSAIEIVEEYEDAVKIKAKEVGTAEFKAYLKEANNTNDVIVVTVKNPSVDYIELTAEKYELFVGETVKVKAKGSSLDEGFTPEFVYETSNKKIATVDENGLVTAVGGGKVQIIAHEKNDSNLYQAIEINVKYGVVAELKLEETSASIKVGETYKIKGIAYDANGSSNTVKQTFTYTVTPTKKVSITDEGVVKGLDEGTVTITVTAGTQKQKLTLDVSYKTEIEKDELVLINGQSTAVSFSEYFAVKGLSAKYVSGDAETIVLSSKDTKVKGVKVGSVVVNLTNGSVSKDVTITVVNLTFGNETVFKNNTLTKLTLNWTDVEKTDNIVESELLLTGADGDLEYEVSSSNEDVFKTVKTDEGFKLEIINIGISTLKIVAGNFVKEITITVDSK